MTNPLSTTATTETDVPFELLLGGVRGLVLSTPMEAIGLGMIGVPLNSELTSLCPSGERESE